MENRDTTKRGARTAEEFSQSVMDLLNKSALALMTSIGHRTGLFDTMSQLPPSTSQQIAEAAGLSERYVREWLGAMTAGGIVECETGPEGPRFWLPEAHAASLTRAAQADNIAVLTQYVAVMGAVEDHVVECFYKGGGVSYAHYHRFHEVMREDSGQSVGFSLINHILPLVPGLKQELERGLDVLDVGCGSGRAINLMARHFPNSRFVGFDLSGDAIAFARAEAELQGNRNARFEQRDLSTFDADAPERAFDLVTAFDAIHDQARPDRVLAGICRALRPGGLFLMQDISGSSHIHENRDHPIGPFLYTISCMHCMTVSLAQEGGMGLGAMWGRQQAEQMLREAGFAEVEVKSLPHDIQNHYYLARPRAEAARQVA